MVSIKKTKKQKYMRKHKKTKNKKKVNFYTQKETRNKKQKTRNKKQRGGDDDNSIKEEVQGILNTISNCFKTNIFNHPQFICGINAIKENTFNRGSNDPAYNSDIYGMLFGPIIRFSRIPKFLTKFVSDDQGNYAIDFPISSHSFNAYFIDTNVSDDYLKDIKKYCKPVVYDVGDVDDVNDESNEGGGGFPFFRKETIKNLPIPIEYSSHMCKNISNCINIDESNSGILENIDKGYYALNYNNNDYLVVNMTDIISPTTDDVRDINPNEINRGIRDYYIDKVLNHSAKRSLKERFAEIENKYTLINKLSSLPSEHEVRMKCPQYRFSYSLNIFSEFFSNTIISIYKKNEKKEYDLQYMVIFYRENYYIIKNALCKDIEAEFVAISNYWKENEPAINCNNKDPLNEMPNIKRNIAMEIKQKDNDIENIIEVIQYP
jgi:hypothetical protein